MNPLASRKQLLIAESELNRAQLVQELETIKDKVHSLATQAKTIGIIASAAASLVAGLSSFRDKRSEPGSKKPSWLQTVLNGAGLAGSLWAKFHSPPAKADLHE